MEACIAPSGYSENVFQHDNFLARLWRPVTACVSMLRDTREEYLRLNPSFGALDPLCHAVTSNLPITPASFDTLGEPKQYFQMKTVL